MTEAQKPIQAPAPAAAVRPAVGVMRLTLTDFRGYGAARLELDGAPVVLTGPNGAGKTNLLEAVSFLAPGRGLRGARLGEIDRRVPPAKPTERRPAPGRSPAGCETRGAARCGSAPAATPRRRRAPHGAHRRRRQRARRSLRDLAIRLADAADGSPVHRRARRAAPLSRPAGARLRPGARRAGRRL